MNTSPPTGRVRRKNAADKFTVERWQLERIIEVSRHLHRASFFIPLFNDVEKPRSYWGRIEFGCVLCGLLDNLENAIKVLDPVIGDFQKLMRRR